MNLPKVSIIIPIYNAEKYIKQSVESYLSISHNYPNCEYVFVNDASVDKSSDILCSILTSTPDINSIVINHSKNLGVAASRQSGLNAATGDYIIFFDSDDLADPNIINRLVETAIKTNSEITVCGYTQLKSTGETPIKPKQASTPHEYLRNILCGFEHASLCNKLVKKKLYDIQNINFIDGINMREDFLVIHQLVFYASRISFIEDTLYKYRRHSESATLCHNYQKHQLGTYKLIGYVTPLLSRELPDDFMIFLIGLLPELGLYCDLSIHDKYSHLFKTITIWGVIHHPNLSLFEKLISVLLLYGPRIGLHFIRVMYGFRIAFHNRAKSLLQKS